MITPHPTYRPGPDYIGATALYNIRLVLVLLRGEGNMSQKQEAYGKSAASTCACQRENQGSPALMEDWSAEAVSVIAVVT